MRVGALSVDPLAVPGEGHRRVVVHKLKIERLPRIKLQQFLQAFSGENSMDGYVPVLVAYSVAYGPVVTAPAIEMSNISMTRAAQLVPLTST